MNRSRHLIWSLVLATLLTAFSACQNAKEDEPEFEQTASESESTSGSTTISRDKVIGLWYCEYQKWIEDGEVDQESYEPSREYCICFEDDGYGFMRSGSDELFEIGTHGKNLSFTWELHGNKIYTDIYDGEIYTIDSVDNKKLVLSWRDGGYKIIARFVLQD